MSESRRLPDGTYTRSVTKYLKAWEAETQPLADALSLRRVSWDPDVCYADEQGRCVDMPLWMVRKITAALSAAEGRHD